MINYKSTRGEKKLYTFSEVILKGIAKDGGLFVPTKIPQFRLGQLKALASKSYQQRAEYIFSLFETDFSKKLIKRIVKKAYSSNFDDQQIAPVINVKENQYILELWHGPTGAFKDIALQIMPLFFQEAIKKDNSRRILQGNQPLKYIILVATSGDTGAAVLEGYKGNKWIRVVVLYPYGHVSKFQELQMVTKEGVNVAVYAIKSDFDKAQRLVKDIFNDKKFNKDLFDQYHAVLSSANSINWGRIVPQIIYYVSGYLDLVNKKNISFGEQIDIAVPTGNFGNILAAFYAKKMGLPIRKLICASNENNVLTKFLNYGIYDVANRKLIKTSSSAIDILVSSNIERLLYLITQNSKKVSGWMQQLNEKGKFEVDESTKKILKKEFYADFVTEKECLQNVKKIYKEVNYPMDPHTSVVQKIADNYMKKGIGSTPIIICSTAHWAKFLKKKSVFSEKSIPKKFKKIVLKQVIHKLKYDVDEKLIEQKILAMN